MKSNWVFWSCKLVGGCKNGWLTEKIFRKNIQDQKNVADLNDDLFAKDYSIICLGGEGACSGWAHLA